MLVLDISCQYLGDECKLEGFCAPFGRRVGECTFLKLYSSITNDLGNICQLNIYVGIGYIMGDECKLEGFCAAYGCMVGECTFLKIYICIGYMLPTIWGIYIS